jgi:hypothetical protein
LHEQRAPACGIRAGHPVLRLRFLRHASAATGKQEGAEDADGDRAGKPEWSRPQASALR